MRRKIQLMEQREAEDVLDVKQVRAMLGNMGRTTLQRRIEDGTLKPLPTPPGRKRPAKLLFRRSDIEALLKESQG